MSYSIRASVDAVLLYGVRRLRRHLRSLCETNCEQSFVTGSVDAREIDVGYDVTAWGRPWHGLFSIGRGVLFNKGSCSGFMDCKTGQGHGSCDFPFYIKDKFEDPLDVFNIIPGKYELPGAMPYGIHGDWIEHHLFSI